MTVLIPMAGSDSSFKERGYHYCKSLVEIDGKPLIERVLSKLSTIRDAQFLFVIRKDEDEHFHLGDVLRLLSPDCGVVVAESNTAGAACTCLLAIEKINSDDELIIANGDQLIQEDISGLVEKMRSSGWDGGVIVFESVHPRWSYVRVDQGGIVVEAAEKRPISRLATAGVYYFRRGSDFVGATMSMIKKDAQVNGGFFVCPVMNELVLRQARIGVHKISRDSYVSLARADDVEAYRANHIRSDPHAA